MLLTWLQAVTHGEMDAAWLRSSFEKFTPRSILGDLFALDNDGLATVRQLLDASEIERFFRYLYNAPSPSPDAIRGALTLRTLKGLLYGTALVSDPLRQPPSEALLAPLGNYLAHLEATAERMGEGEFRGSTAFATGYYQTIARAYRTARRSEEDTEHDAPESLRQRRIYIVAGTGKQRALVGRLYLTMIPGKGAIYADPLSMSLAPLSPSFQEAIRAAWKHCQECQLSVPDGVDLVWRIEGIPLLGFRGGSLGGAFALALRLFLLNEFVDDDVVITATVSGDRAGGLGPVEMVGEKVEAALAFQIVPPIRRILVHPDNATEARDAVFRADLDPGEVIYPVHSVEECLRVASNLDAWFLRRERRLIRELAQQRTGRAFPDDATLRSACIPPQVQRERWHSGGGLTLDLPVEWSEVRQQPHSAIVTGASGYGKTMLLWHAVMLPPNGVSMAFYIPASELSRELSAAPLPWNSEDTSSGMTVAEEGAWLVKTVSTLILRRHGYTASSDVPRWLKARIESGRCLIAIDALNEVASSVRAELLRLIARFLQSAEGKNARLLLSSQPDDFHVTEQLTPTSISRYRLHHFGAERMQALIMTWLHNHREIAASLCERLRQIYVAPSLRPQSQEVEAANIMSLLRVPLYLRLVCEVASTGDIGTIFAALDRRSHLFEQFFAHMLRQWFYTPPIPMATERAVMADFVADVAYYLYCRPQQPQESTIGALRGILQNSMDTITQAARPDTQGGLLPRMQSLLAQLPNKRGAPTHIGSMLRGKLLEVRAAIDQLLDEAGTPLTSHTEWSVSFVRDTIRMVLTNERYQVLRHRDLFQDLQRLKILAGTGVGTEREIFGFSHQSLGEYLCARSLAWRANHKGWSSVLDEVAHLSISPEFKEVIILLAGQLQDPTILLRDLQDRRRDDEYRSRLALAAECFREIRMVRTGSTK